MRASLHRRAKTRGMERRQPRRGRLPDEGPAKEEIGATAGKTHAEVLDEVIGPERRMRNEERAREER